MLWNLYFWTFLRTGLTDTWLGWFSQGWSYSEQRVDLDDQLRSLQTLLFCDSMWILDLLSLWSCLDWTHGAPTTHSKIGFSSQCSCDPCLHFFHVVGGGTGEAEFHLFLLSSLRGPHHLVIWKYLKKFFFEAWKVLSYLSVGMKICHLDVCSSYQSTSKVSWENIKSFYLSAAPLLRHFKLRNPYLKGWFISESGL